MNDIHMPDLRVLTNAVHAFARKKKRVPGDGCAKLLMVTDFSAGAAIAEKRAAMLSVELKWNPLEILAVLNNDPAGAACLQRIVSPLAEEDVDPGSAESGLRDIAQRLGQWEGLDYLCSVSFANPIAGILEKVAELRPRLVVSGMYGGSIAANLARGYSTMDLVRALDTPVLVVKREPGASYRRIVVAIDFSALSLRAASAAMEMAPGAELHFLNVIEPVNGPYGENGQVPNEVRLVRRIGADRAAGQRLSRLVSDLGVDPDRSRCTLRHGLAPTAIDSYAKEVDADLIVCGKQSGHASGIRIGSTAMGLLVQSCCDVLVTSTSSGKGKHRGSDRAAA